MELQPLYTLKERLEQAAIAGTGLLDEDFRLQRTAEGLKPLAAASPVFARLDSGLQALLAAPMEQRSGLLLDLLALVDAVAYTQGRTGMDGDLEPLPTGGGTCESLSYGQLQPLLTALTTTGSGRIERIKAAWEVHPECFADFRVLPAVVAGLGDGFGEIAELNVKIVTRIGPAALPLLKAGFDPAGKKEMARRVEAIAAIEGPKATPWLRDILPLSKKEVRAAVLLALGGDPDNTALLLELARSERSGVSRDAVLQALSKLDGADIQAFWTEELVKHSSSVPFLRDTDTAWAAELVASGLRERLEGMLACDCVSQEASEDFIRWRHAIGTKSAPPMLEFWQWACERMEEIDRLKTENDRPVFVGVRLTDTLRDCLLAAGPGPLRDFCLNLFDTWPAMTRYLIPSFQAALLSLPAAEVYETYAPLILMEEPSADAEHKKSLNTVLVRALGDVLWHQERGCHVLIGGQPTAQLLDARWVDRLIGASFKPANGTCYPFVGGDSVNSYDKTLIDLANPTDPEQCARLVPYLRQRMAETGSWFCYSRYLLRFHGSPRGVLKESLQRAKQLAYLYYLWEILSEAAKVLPAEEVAGLCQEALDANRIRGSKEKEIAQRAIPWTIEQLQAGQPFPEWNRWWTIL